MAKKARKKSTAKRRKKAKAARRKKTRAVTRKRAVKRKGKARKARRKPAEGRLANAYHTVMDTVKGTDELRNKLEPPATSETE